MTNRSGNQTRRVAEWLRYALRDIENPTVRELALKWGQTHPEKVKKARDPGNFVVATVNRGLGWLKAKGYAEQYAAPDQPPGPLPWRLTRSGIVWARAVDDSNERNKAERREQAFVCSIRDEVPDGYPLMTRDEVLDSAPRGQPRPHHPTSGLPIPWIANENDLSDANAFRRALCVVERLCQVCGDPLGETAMVCWRPGDVIVTDGAAIHPKPCWPMALHHCPELARLWEEDQLEFAEVPTASLEDVRADQLTTRHGMPLGYRVPEGV